MNQSTAYLKRAFFPLLVNAVTLIGGLFLARRWDRAVLVFSVYVCWLVATWVYFTTLIKSAGFDQPSQFLDAYRNVFTVSLYGLCAIWLGSMASLVIDLRKSEESFPHIRTFSSVSGSVLLSLLSTVMMAYQLAMLISFGTMNSVEIDESGNEVRRFTPSNHFYSNVRFGEDYERSTQFHGRPKAGEGYLQGKIVFQGEPAKKVKLDVSLNNKFKEVGLETDDDGIFTLRLEPGEWYVNSVSTSSWQDKPEGDYLLVSGTEKLYKPRNYMRYDFSDHKGRKVEVTRQRQEPVMLFEIRPVVELVWPAASNDVIQADTTVDVIEWSEVKDANKYLVEISSVERDGPNTKSWRSIYHATTSLASFPLSKIRTVPADGQNQEYLVEITAFTEDGRFVSETGFEAHKRIFRIEAGRMIASEDITEFLGGEFSEDDYEISRMEKEKADAISVLIRESYYDEAEKLLGGLKNNKIDPGVASALKGYLAASTGKCDEANKFFDQAKTSGGKTCVPASYYAGCIQK